MAFDKEKMEDKVKDVLYANLGMAACLNDKLKDKVEEYIDRGKSIVDKGKTIDGEIKRVFDKDEESAE